MNRKEIGFESLSVLGGYGRSDAIEKNSISVPLFQTTAHPYKDSEQAARIYDPEDELDGFIYARTDNPTTDVLQKRLAYLEGGEASMATGSGMGAISLVAMSLLDRNNGAVFSNKLYARSFQLFNDVLPNFSVDSQVVENPEDLNEWEESITDNTKFLFVETPSNPGLFIADIQGLAKIAESEDILLIVDNTLATPALQRPIELGADIVIESTSKYINGSATALGGAIIGSKEYISSLRTGVMRRFGPSASPFNSWLNLLGLETLSLRMTKHSDNALMVAKFLEDHKKVDGVNYPGLDSHPQHDLAASQMDGFSSLMSFTLTGKGTREGAFRFLDKLRMIPNVTHEGCSRTIICHPPSTNFADMTEGEKKEADIPETLIRLSVGIEDVEDIIEDLDQALDSL